MCVELCAGQHQESKPREGQRSPEGQETQYSTTTRLTTGVEMPKQRYHSRKSVIQVLREKVTTEG